MYIYLYRIYTPFVNCSLQFIQSLEFSILSFLYVFFRSHSPFRKICRCHFQFLSISLININITAAVVIFFIAVATSLSLLSLSTLFFLSLLSFSLATLSLSSSPLHQFLSFMHSFFLVRVIFTSSIKNHYVFLFCFSLCTYLKRISHSNSSTNGNRPTLSILLTSFWDAFSPA